MDLLDDELISLWSSFEKNNLKYILVGGFANILNGHHRSTSDMDIWIKNTSENRKALQKSLQETGLTDLPNLEHIDFVPGWPSINLLSGFELDIMTSLKGFEEEEFDECYEVSNEAVIENISIRFFHINQLIRAKKAVNRLKDQADIEELEKIKQQNKSE